MKWLWLGGAVILAVAAAATWFAFHRPDFVAGLVAVAGAALWKALAPAIAKRKPPEEEALWREAVLRGEDPGIRRGTGPSSK